jgi:hypothetical protein
MVVDTAFIATFTFAALAAKAHAAASRSVEKVLLIIVMFFI